MTTLGDARRLARVSEQATWDLAAAAYQRNQAIRECYLFGNATLQQLATATGLSKQRIHMIVKDGEE